LDDGLIKHFLPYVWKKEEFSGKKGHANMKSWMAATYDPDPRAPLEFQMPLNAESGEVIEIRWRNWRRGDPTNLASSYQENL